MNSDGLPRPAFGEAPRWLCLAMRILALVFVGMTIGCAIMIARGEVVLGPVSNGFMFGAAGVGWTVAIASVLRARR